MPAIVPGAMAGARDEAGAAVVLDGAAWYGVVATKGVVVDELVDETSVVTLVCKVGRGDAIVKDVRDVCKLPTGKVGVAICVLTMVVTWVDIWTDVCADVTTVVWVCMLVCVVCTEVTAVEVVVTLLDDGAAGGAPGGGGGAGGATVDGGFSGGTIVSCAGMPGLSTIEFDGGAAVGKGSATNGGAEGAAGAGGADGSAAFPLPAPSLPLPLPSSTNVIPPALNWMETQISITHLLSRLLPCLFPAGAPVEAPRSPSRPPSPPLPTQPGQHWASDASCESRGLAVMPPQPSSLKLGRSPFGFAGIVRRHSHVRICSNAVTVGSGRGFVCENDDEDSRWY